MPTISAKLVKAKTPRKCEDCHRYIMPGERYLRMFGMAFRGDSPYAIRICEKCAPKVNDKKAEKVVTEWRGEHESQ